MRSNPIVATLGVRVGGMAFVLGTRGVHDSAAIGLVGLAVLVLCALFALVGGVMERRARRRGW